VNDGVERILGRLRDGGGRVTEPRRAVVTALMDAGRHITAEELAASVQAGNPDVHLSTVYRILDTLEQLGVVDHVHLGHGPAVYHLTEAPHHHLVCEACGAVIEVPDEVFAPVSSRLATDYGFLVDPHHFAVVGRCAGCA
jgi:Fur family transcriptional regulator, ferric uptake regulator